MIDIQKHSRQIALALLGEQNKKKSTADELRWGTNGSLSVNIRKGTFTNFETDESGGMVDLIKLYHGDNVSDFLGNLGLDDTMQRPVKSNGSAGQIKRYSSLEMQQLRAKSELCSIYSKTFCVMRFSGKEYRPFRKEEDGMWVMKRPDGLLPLLMTKGDESIPALIVEGEKALMGAAKLYGGVVVAWHGGVKAVAQSDWTGIKNEQAIIWPDNDNAGRQVAKEIKDHLKSIGIKSTIAKPPDHFEEKDDLYDAYKRCEDINIIEYTKENELDPGSRVAYFNYGDFKNKDYPATKWMINNLMARGHLAMLHGAPGHGKSLLTQIMAVCLAAGYDFGHYHIEEPQKVLLVDAEMPPVSLQERFAKMMMLFDGEIEKEELIKRVNQNLIIVSHHDQPEGLIPINLPEGKEWYINLIEDINPDFIILDNLITLTAFEDSNSSTEWVAELNPLLLKMRRQDRAVLFLHHSGKSGKQLGSVAKEVILDCVIRIELQIDEDDDGFWSLENSQYESRFKWTFEKTRHFYGQDAYPVLWKYSNGILTKDKTDKEMRVSMVVRLKNEGLSNKEIATQLKTSERTVRRDIDKAKKLHLYDDSPEF